MAATMALLFAEDFSALPVGVIGGEYSPAGEYHVVPRMVNTGRWRETVVHHSYRRISSGNWQVVPENDGRHVLEQTLHPEKWQPMLVAGWPYDWPTATVAASIKPLTTGGWRALIVRYRHARRFYALRFAAGQVALIRRDNDVDTVLGETAGHLDCDRYTRVEVQAEAAGFRVLLDGQTAFACRDDSAAAFDTGGVGFAADDLTRFRDLRVTAAAPLAQAAAAQAAAAETARAGLRARHPQPKLWRKIPTPGFGTDRNLRVGDIDGDGQAELVLARRTHRAGGDDYASICSLAAYGLDGKPRWTWGEPGTTTEHTTADLCFQLHDLTAAGHADVWFCRDFELCTADGRTGQVHQRLTLPQPVKSDGWPRSLHRILGDAIFFCDLCGHGRPDSIILKDRYKNAWAYDRNLKPLWQFSGNLGHFPYARDIDGDGREEVAFGYHLLDHDGRCQWTREFTEHADNLALIDWARDGGAGGTPAGWQVVIAGSDAGFILLDGAGQTRLHYPIGHAQSLCIGNLLPGREGLEIMVNTFWGPAGITATFDEHGNLLHEFEPMPYACLLQPVNWAPAGAGQRAADLVLLSTHPTQGGLIDGEGRRVVEFPDDGHPWLCSDARDLDGDGVDEVLTWDEHSIWIYKPDRAVGRTPENYPRRNPWYNDSNYRAQISLPR